MRKNSGFLCKINIPLSPTLMQGTPKGAATINEKQILFEGSIERCHILQLECLMNKIIWKNRTSKL
ncbi:hypothetical protein [Candidatus Odyssella thessalonicensis]|uniref:hypothetical protein n=1 Tax=Candidatus Odyssella thessalonicensis TaxID=84647 RepID=UPI000225B4C3|nr:hypothetical protein [Candidatus Odyssella thessalonicensis]